MTDILRTENAVQDLEQATDKFKEIMTTEQASVDVPGVGQTPSLKARVDAALQNPEKKAVEAANNAKQSEQSAATDAQRSEDAALRAEQAISQTVIWGGDFTPTPSNEYPDTSTINKNTEFKIKLDRDQSYTFTGGQLVGIEARNLDTLIFETKTQSFLFIPSGIKDAVTISDMEGYSEKKSFNSLQDAISSFPNSDYKVGSKIEWQGYWSQSDGGSGWGVIKGGNVLGDGGSKIRINDQFYIEQNLTRVNVKKFGAMGNWATDTQTGSDDTIPFQNAFKYAGLASRRHGWRPSVYAPDGQYMISDTLNVSNAASFDFELSSYSRSTTIWAGVGSEKYVFNIDIEYTFFTNITIKGNTLESDVNKAKGIWKCKNKNGYADVDIHLTNCDYGRAVKGCHIYGRGFTHNGGSVSHVEESLFIESPDPWIKRGGDYTDTFKSGMRHYELRGVRYDNVRALVSTSENGPAADYINGLQIIGCSGLIVERLLEIGNTGSQLTTGVRGRVCNSLITGNEFMYSFFSGIIKGNSIESSQILGNNFTRKIDVDEIPKNASESIESMVDVNGIKNLIIDDNTTKGIVKYVVNANTEMRGLSLESNDFPYYNAFKPSGNTYVVRTGNPNATENVKIHGNGFTQNGQALYGKQYYINEDLLSTKVSISGNTSDYDFEQHTTLFSPKLFVGSSISSATVSSNMQWYTEDNYIVADAVCNFSDITESGVLSITLPVPAVESTPASSWSAQVAISDVNGLIFPTGEMLAPPIITVGGGVPDGDRIRMMKTTLSNGKTISLTTDNIIGNEFNLKFHVRYKYK